MTGDRPSDARPYLLAEWSGGGGLGHYAHLLADALARRHPRVTLFTRRGQELTPFPHAHAIRSVWPAAPARLRGRPRRVVVGVGQLWGWMRFIRHVAALRACRPIVHLQSLEQPQEVLAAVLLRLAGATIVLTMHNVRPHDAGPLRRRSQIAALGIPDAIMAHTEEVRRAILSSRPAARVRVLGHPSYRPLVEMAGDPTAGPSGPMRVAVLGMIRPYKGLEFIVDAFTRVRLAGVDCELRVAGRTSDVRSTEAVLGRAPDGSVSAHLGYLPLGRFVREVQEADVVFLGHRSTSESGIAQVALAAGVPVVAPRMGALQRLLQGRPEWLYSPDDPGDAAERLRAVLAEQSRARGTLTAAARALADATPSWDDMAQACLDAVADPAREPTA